MKSMVLGLIKFYRKYISPLKPPTCRFEPTCSAYTLEAVERHGVAKGLLLGFWRVLRCNPFSEGGHDPVPEVFKPWASRANRRNRGVTRRRCD